MSLMLLNSRPDLQRTVAQEMRGQHIRNVDKTEVVLSLLRINTDEALLLAEELAGCPIQICPPFLPIWPPRPVASSQQGPRLIRKDPNPCIPSTGMFTKYESLRVGMTLKQIRERGLIPPRDLRYLTARGHIEFSKDRVK